MCHAQCRIWPLCMLHWQHVCFMYVLCISALLHTVQNIREELGNEANANEYVCLVSYACLVPGPPRFSIFIHYNTQKRKSGQNISVSIQLSCSDLLWSQAVPPWCVQMRWWRQHIGPSWQTRCQYSAESSVWKRGEKHCQWQREEERGKREEEMKWRTKWKGRSWKGGRDWRWDEGGRGWKQGRNEGKREKGGEIWEGGEEGGNGRDSPHSLVWVLYLIKSHTVHLDSLRVLSLLHIDVSHVDTQPTYKQKYLNWFQNYSHG